MSGNFNVFPASLGSLALGMLWIISFLCSKAHKNIQCHQQQFWLESFSISFLPVFFWCICLWYPNFTTSLMLQCVFLVLFWVFSYRLIVGSIKECKWRVNSFSCLFCTYFPILSSILKRELFYFHYIYTLYSRFARGELVTILRFRTYHCNKKTTNCVRVTRTMIRTGFNLGPLSVHLSTRPRGPALYCEFTYVVLKPTTYCTALGIWQI